MYSRKNAEPVGNHSLGLVLCLWNLRIQSIHQVHVGGVRLRQGPRFHVRRLPLIQPQGFAVSKNGGLPQLWQLPSGKLT